MHLWTSKENINEKNNTDTLNKIPSLQNLDTSALLNDKSYNIELSIRNWRIYSTYFVSIVKTCRS